MAPPSTINRPRVNSNFGAKVIVFVSLSKFCPPVMLAARAVLVASPLVRMSVRPPMTVARPVLPLVLFVAAVNVSARVYVAPRRR